MGRDASASGARLRALAEASSTVAGAPAIGVAAVGDDGCERASPPSPSRASPSSCVVVVVVVVRCAWYSVVLLGATLAPSAALLGGALVASNGGQAVLRASTMAPCPATRPVLARATSPATCA